MKDNSLLLCIADLIIHISIDTDSNKDFLYNAYVDFVTTKKKINGQIRINASDTSYIQIKNNILHIPIIDIQRNFQLFNDYLRLAFSYILNRNRGVLIHASALEINNQGIVFMGHEGAGKSTIRTLLPEYICLGDDIAIIRNIGKTWYVFGSPFYQRTYRTYPNIKVVLKSIFSIKQAKDTSAWLSKFPENLTSISKNSFIAGFSDTVLEQQLQLSTCLDLSQNIPCFKLNFEKNREFLPIIQQASAMDVINIDPQTILKDAYPRIKKSLGKKINWSIAIVPWSFLNTCTIINGITWRFEFGLRRTIKEIARIVSSKNLLGYHSSKILYLTKNLTKIQQWCILYKTTKNYTVLDGNHSSVARIILGRKGISTTVNLLIAIDDGTLYN